MSTLKVVVWTVLWSGVAKRPRWWFSQSVQVFQWEQSEMIAGCPDQTAGRLPKLFFFPGPITVSTEPLEFIVKPCAPSLNPRRRVLTPGRSFAPRCLRAATAELIKDYLFSAAPIVQICLSPPNWVLIWSNQDFDGICPRVTRSTQVWAPGEEIQCDYVIWLLKSKWGEFSLRPSCERKGSFGVYSSAWGAGTLTLFNNNKKKRWLPHLQPLVFRYLIDLVSS